jgi:hypothetical protein
MHEEPNNLAEAQLEIDRLRAQLAEAEKERDAYWRTVENLLPPLPPELEYLNAPLEEVLKGAIPFDEAFIESLDSLDLSSNP